MNLQRLYREFCSQCISAQDGWGGRSQVDYWLMRWKVIAAEFCDKESLDRWEEEMCNGF